MTLCSAAHKRVVMKPQFLCSQSKTCGDSARLFTLCSERQLCGRPNGLTQEVPGMAYCSLASQSLHKGLWAHFTEVTILLQLACMNLTFLLEAADTVLLLKSHNPIYSYLQNMLYKKIINQDVNQAFLTHFLSSDIILFYYSFCKPAKANTLWCVKILFAVKLPTLKFWQTRTFLCL